MKKAGGLLKKEIEKNLNDFIFQFNKGNYTSLDNCEFCGKSIDYYYSENIIYFKCNHIFHKKCFEEKKCDEYICPICSKKEKEVNIYKIDENKKEIICNYLFDIDYHKNENDIIKRDEINDEKKIEIQKLKLKKKNLAKLRRIKKMKKEINYLFDEEFLQ